MATVIQDKPQRNPQGQPRWDRFERAELFEQYQQLRTQGLSERQAAKELKVPRSTLQAWRLWHDSLDICPHVADFFQSGPGLAFLHRLVIAFHLVCAEIGACGIRLVCLFLRLTGLDRFVAASYGAQQRLNRQIEEAMVDYGHSETARLAKAMPQKDLTVTQDETFTGGLCLITMDPESNFIILEQLAQGRDQVSWNDAMAPALAQLNCRVIQSARVGQSGLGSHGEQRAGGPKGRQPRQGAARTAPKQPERHGAGARKGPSRPRHQLPHDAGVSRASTRRGPSRARASRSAT
jgi:hypothetical protein